MQFLMAETHFIGDTEEEFRKEAWGQNVMKIIDLKIIDTHIKTESTDLWSSTIRVIRKHQVVCITCELICLLGETSMLHINSQVGTTLLASAPHSWCLTPHFWCHKMDQMSRNTQTIQYFGLFRNTNRRIYKLRSWILYAQR